MLFSSIGVHFSCQDIGKSWKFLWNCNDDWIRGQCLFFVREGEIGPGDVHATCRPRCGQELNGAALLPGGFFKGWVGMVIMVHSPKIDFQIYPNHIIVVLFPMKTMSLIVYPNIFQ